MSNEHGTISETPSLPVKSTSPPSVMTDAPSSISNISSKQSSPISIPIPSKPISTTTATTSSSPSSSSSSEAEELVPIIFTWTAGGDSISISGSWDSYKTVIQLHKAGASEHTILLYLQPGVFHYKYLVDDVWKVNHINPTRKDKLQNTITVYEIPKTFDFDDFIDLSKQHEPRSPLSTYACPRLPPDNSSDPPSLPPHLEAGALKPLPDDISPVILKMSQANLFNQQKHQEKIDRKAEKETRKQRNSNINDYSYAMEASSPASPCPARPGIDVARMARREQRENQQQQHQYRHNQNDHNHSPYRRRRAPTNMNDANIDDDDNDKNTKVVVRPFFSHVFIDHLYEAKNEPGDAYNCMAQTCRIGSKVINTILVVDASSNHHHLGNHVDTSRQSASPSRHPS